MSPERDYVLGAHDAEITRLGLQHRVWRPRALDAWRRAGFTTGGTIVDVGCGPGWASIDLAEIVGPSGRVVAVERSRRFLDALNAAAALRGLDNVTACEMDLDEGDLPVTGADGAWIRWAFSFVRNPMALARRVHAALRPGGTLVAHEYLDYSTWRLAPRCPELETYVQAVMASWRAEGGEPDIALDLPRGLAEAGFAIRSLKPIVDVIPPRDFIWQWPKAFVEVGLRRLVDLGRLTEDESRSVSAALERAERTPGTLMITPMVLEIIAER